MRRKTIEGSSNIAEVGYDLDAMTLEVKFVKGGIYRYWPITQSGYENLMNAESMGSYFAKHIRSNPKIEYQEVDDLQADQ